MPFNHFGLAIELDPFACWFFVAIVFFTSLIIVFISHFFGIFVNRRKQWSVKQMNDVRDRMRPKLQKKRRTKINLEFLLFNIVLSAWLLSYSNQSCKRACVSFYIIKQKKKKKTHKSHYISNFNFFISNQIMK